MEAERQGRKEGGKLWCGVECVCMCVCVCVREREREGFVAFQVC